MKKRLVKLGFAGIVLAGLSTALSAAIVGVDGRSNIFEAGRGTPGADDGTTGGFYPVLGATFGAGAGQTISFNSVTGTTNCGSGAPCDFPPIGPDGSSLVFTVGATDGTNIPTSGVGTGMSGIVFNGRQMFLVGVFLDDSTPAGFGAFAPTFANTAGSGVYGANQTTYAPFFIGQTFYIGDGLTGTGSGTTQVWQVPDTATRLFLGFADSFNNFSGAPSAYGDNTGSLTVDVNTTGLTAIPEPGTIILMGLGLVGLGLLRKKIA